MIFFGIDLGSRGYDTYILWYDHVVNGFTEHTRIANNLFIDYYVTIHSNANTGTPANPDAAFCSNSLLRGTGTEVLYNTANTANFNLSGTNFAQKLVDTVSQSSPGPNRGLKPSTIHEPRVINYVPMGYLEAEFHDWDPGFFFLNQRNWQWSIASAIDSHNRGF